VIHHGERKWTRALEAHLQQSGCSASPACRATRTRWRATTQAARHRPTSAGSARLDHRNRARRARAIIFTAGIGEIAVIRDGWRAAARGQLDATANQRGAVLVFGFRVAVPTNEELVIARHAAGARSAMKSSLYVALALRPAGVLAPGGLGAAAS
jgi:hypothetical protein